MLWMIRQRRTREHEWLQSKAGALGPEAWDSYRGVIYFVLGTPRAREFWALTKIYFNEEFVQMVDEMIQDAPLLDYWDKLREIK